MTIQQNINRLVSYGLHTGLISSDDVIYTQNKLLELFQIDGFETGANKECIPETAIGDLESILGELTDYAVAHKLIQNESIVYRDLFDTKIMGLLVPPPSVVRDRFWKEYQKGPQYATEFFYKFSQDTDYIRRYRICKDLKWKTETSYGSLDITINLSKPEKDPKAIAAARNVPQGGYPACLLCKENEGYAGRVNHAARQNHRIIPLTLHNETWGFQYSPYVYYNEHCIVFNYNHVPMKICHDTFCRLFDFVTQFPHYTLGSNADLPIVGGSILTHDHFQGGNYIFPMTKAQIEETFVVKGFDDISVGILHWPMSVLRLSGSDPVRVITLADHILDTWRSYTDCDAGIFARTAEESHNTITPIARRRSSLYELDLVLRNNITTKEHPLGVFHPHAELHHIKKENIGLIEVMGLAVLPSRLKFELGKLRTAILSHSDIRADDDLSKHADWVESFIPSYSNLSEDTIDAVLQKETGLVFSQVLEHAGVYKHTEQGKFAFRKFIAQL